MKALMSTKAPFTTAQLKALPRNAYAYRNAQGVWSLRQDTETVETTIENGDNRSPRSASVYEMPHLAVLTVANTNAHETALRAVSRQYDGALLD